MQEGRREEEVNARVKGETTSVGGKTQARLIVRQSVSHNPCFIFLSSWIYSSQSQCLHSSPKANSDPVRAGAGPRQLVDLSSHIRSPERLVQDVGGRRWCVATTAAAAPRFAMCLLRIIASILPHLIYLPDEDLVVVA